MRVGSQVGYRIRLENKTSRDTRLEFVTVGILLRQLTTAASDASMLGNITHIFIDEVHERSVDIDFLLMILKQVRKANPRLRIVLMSATVDAQLFQSYFDGCPAISIPGKTFPVEDYFLSDLYGVLDYRPRGKFLSRGLDGDALEQAVAQEQALDERDRRKQEAKTADFGAPTEMEAFEAAVRTATSQIDYDLLEHTLWYICDQLPPGGILVFLPGAPEINNVKHMLERSLRTSSQYQPSDFWIVPLHGSLTSQGQQMVFGKTPKGVRKIVLATNIAETSITVADIVYVVVCMYVCCVYTCMYAYVHVV
jgi:HrpA-like RNA helicase